MEGGGSFITHRTRRKFVSFNERAHDIFERWNFVISDRKSKLLKVRELPSSCPSVRLNLISAAPTGTFQLNLILGTSYESLSRKSEC
jgi:hypothetical protein